MLKLRGVFLAGLALHPSAEPNTLVLRAPLDQRDLLIEDAPLTYYITPYYRPYPLVLVRLAQLHPSALHDLLAVSWRLANAKSKKS